MPRRIRLEFDELAERLPCPLTGLASSQVVRTYRTKPYGVMYTAFVHPLSPYYKAKANDVFWLPVHPQPGGIPYREWPKLVSLGQPTARPAVCVTTATHGRLHFTSGSGGPRPRIAATGYDMDNMKARGFIEASLPIFFPASGQEEQFHANAAKLVSAAEIAASLAGGAVRNAFEGDHGDAKSTPYENLRERFYADTEADFYNALERLENGGALDAAVWLKILRNKVMSLFDETVPIEHMPDKLIDRSVKARAGLAFALKGYGKMGNALFTALGLPLPDTKAKLAKAKRSRKSTGVPQ